MVSNSINYVGPWLGRHLHRGMQIFVKTKNIQDQMKIGRHDPRQGSCPGNPQDPRQDPCRGRQRATARPLSGHPARPSPRTPAGPPPGPRQPSFHHNSHAAASPTSWAGNCVASCSSQANSSSACVAACKSSCRLHRATSAACLPTWHRTHHWPRRVSKRGGAAMDGTGLAPAPDKAEGHLSYALKTSCPIIRAISSGHCAPFHLLCATVAAPSTIKGGPWHTGEGFGSSEPSTHHS